MVALASTVCSKEMSVHGSGGGKLRLGAERIPRGAGGGTTPLATALGMCRGLHAPYLEEDLSDRGSGTFRIGMPKLKSVEVISAMTRAFLETNRACERRLAPAKAEESQRKREKSAAQEKQVTRPIL